MRWLAIAAARSTSRPRAHAPRHAFPVASRSVRTGDDPRCGHPVRTRSPSTSLRPAARWAHRDRQVPDARLAGSGVGGNRARRLHPPDANDPPATRPRPKTVRDHTGYYNEVERFRCCRSSASRCAATRSTTRPTRASAGRAAILGVALNEVFVRCCRSSTRDPDFYLPPRAAAIARGGVAEETVSRHAKRVMFGVWGFLRQFMYTRSCRHRRRRRRARLKEVIWRSRRASILRATRSSFHRRRSNYLDFACCVGLAARWASTPPTSGRRDCRSGTPHPDGR